MFENANHIGSDVVVKVIEAGAQIVHAGLAVATFDESVFGTFPPTELEVVTTAALLGQGIALVHAKFFLHDRKCHITQMRLRDIAEPILGINKVVTRVHLTIMFNGKSFAAKFGLRTRLGGHSRRLRDRCFK